MKNRTLVFISLIALSIAAFSCKKSSPVTYQVKATVNGAAWSATTVSANTAWSGSSDTMLAVVGVDSVSGKTITLEFRPYRGVPVTFSLSDTSSRAAAYLDKGSTTSIAKTGSMSITSVSSSLIQGTFQFTTYDSIVVTNGTFNVTGGL